MSPPRPHVLAGGAPPGAERTHLYLFVQQGAPRAYSGRGAADHNAGMVELQESDPQALAAQAAYWRQRALRGERQARGIAHTLEVKLRQLRGSAPAVHHDLDTRPLAPWPGATRWWARWRRR